MKVHKLHLILLFIAARNAYSHSLLDSTHFQSYSSEVLDGSVAINDNQGHNENDLGFMVENELDSLRQHTAMLLEILSRKNEIQLHLPLEYLTVLSAAFQTSFQNVTFMTKELRFLISESSEATVSDNLTTERNDSSHLFDKVQEKFSYLKEGVGNELQCRLMIEEAVERVKGSEKKAKEMVDTALSSLNEIKEQASEKAIARMNVEKTRFVKCVDELSTRMSRIYTSSFEDEKIQNNKNNPSDLNFDKVLDIETWKNAGYTYSDIFNWTLVSNGSAVDLLQILPLKKYRLRNDSKKDVLFAKDSSKDEMRTRTHIGVIDSNIASEMIDPSLYHHGELEPTLLHYIHLKALSELASDINYVHASIEVLTSFTTMQGSELNDSINSLLQGVDNASSNRESLSDLAAKVAAAEAELTTKEISSLLQNIKHTLRMQRENIKLEKLYSVMDANAISNYEQNIDEMHLEKDRKKQSTKREFSLESVLEVFNLINVLSSSANNTLRETSTLFKSVHDDQMSQISLIHADAKKERKDEAASLKVINILGEEARKALLQMIEVIFQHIVDGLLHLMTKEEGRHQVLLVIIAASSLVFSVSFSKEIIGVVFKFAIRTLSMPRLVREWGCASSRNQSMGEAQLSDIILPKKDKERLMKLCNTIKKGKSRRAPLRNVLIHGKTGTGKSLISREIAKSAPGIPFAIMSGADIAPLESHGPSELRNVLSWADRQRHGGIIVIDEAESALGKRIRLQKISQTDSNDDKSLLSARDALNVFLSLTGESGGNIMLILTTSNPSALDEAVLDRCDDMIKCKLPTQLERFGILTNELSKRFKGSQDITREDDSIFTKLMIKKNKRLFFDQSFNAESALQRVSEDVFTLGFSGRELSKIIRAVETAVYTSESNVLTINIWNATVYDMCTSIKNKKNIHQDELQHDNENFDNQKYTK